VKDKQVYAVAGVLLRGRVPQSDVKCSATHAVEWHGQWRGKFDTVVIYGKVISIDRGWILENTKSRMTLRNFWLRPQALEREGTNAIALKVNPRRHALHRRATR
jgi:hypothetical protein